MDWKTKYVKTENGEIIMFPETIMHSDFKKFNPISAGFCHIRHDKKTVECYGESISLRLNSDPKKDSFEATCLHFGLESALEYFE